MKSLSFVSLKLDLISLEVIGWVLRSLKRDEMTPTEKTIQSRVKEAFAYKITPSLWKATLNQIKGLTT